MFYCGKEYNKLQKSWDTVARKTDVVHSTGNQNRKGSRRSFEGDKLIRDDDVRVVFLKNTQNYNKLIIIE